MAAFVLTCSQAQTGCPSFPVAAVGSVYNKKGTELLAWGTFHWCTANGEEPIPFTKLSSQFGYFKIEVKNRPQKWITRSSRWLERSPESWGQEFWSSKEFAPGVSERTDSARHLGHTTIGLDD